MNPSLKKLAESNALTFVKHPATDRVQFWCAEINASIFITEQGIVIAGPDLIVAPLVSANRFAELHPA